MWGPHHYVKSPKMPAFLSAQCTIRDKRTPIAGCCLLLDAGLMLKKERKKRSWGKSSPCIALGGNGCEQELYAGMSAMRCTEEGEKPEQCGLKTRFWCKQIWALPPTRLHFLLTCKVRIIRACTPLCQAPNGWCMWSTWPCETPVSFQETVTATTIISIVNILPSEFLTISFRTICHK